MKKYKLIKLLSLGLLLFGCDIKHSAAVRGFISVNNAFSSELTFNELFLISQSRAEVPIMVYSPSCTSCLEQKANALSINNDLKGTIFVLNYDLYKKELEENFPNTFNGYFSTPRFIIFKQGKTTYTMPYNKMKDRESLYKTVKTLLKDDYFTFDNEIKITPSDDTEESLIIFYKSSSESQKIQMYDFTNQYKGNVKNKQIIAYSEETKSYYENFYDYYFNENNVSILQINKREVVGLNPSDFNI